MTVDGIGVILEPKLDSQKSIKTSKGEGYEEKMGPATSQAMWRRLLYQGSANNHKGLPTLFHIKLTNILALVV